MLPLLLCFTNSAKRKKTVEIKIEKKTNEDEWKSQPGSQLNCSMLESRIAIYSTIIIKNNRFRFSKNEPSSDSKGRGKSDYGDCDLRVGRENEK